MGVPATYTGARRAPSGCCAVQPVVMTERVDVDGTTLDSGAQGGDVLEPNDDRPLPVELFELAAHMAEPCQAEAVDQIQGS